MTVKLQFIGNDNPFRDSSAGVQFFSASHLSPSEFIVQEVMGLVSDLVVEDDPEMSWHDYFRAAKSSNDSRLRVLYRLSATVRKEVGKKVIEAGGNAVLGYSSHFDVEGDSGIVVRAYGTVCRLLKVYEYEGETHGGGSVAAAGGGGGGQQLEREVSGLTTASHNSGGGGGGPLGLPAAPTSPPLLLVTEHSGGPSLSMSLSPSPTSPVHPLPLPLSVPALVNTRSNTSTASSFGLHSHAASSTRSFVSSAGGGGGGGSSRSLLVPFGPASQAPRDPALGDTHPGLASDDELQILSLKSFEPHVRIRYGGLVMAKAVKFLGKLASSLSDQETREGWWEELRSEIKNHASTLCCTHVIGYSELSTIYGDVCVLTCSGTAATVKGFTHPTLYAAPTSTSTPLAGGGGTTAAAAGGGGGGDTGQSHPIEFSPSSDRERDPSYTNSNPPHGLPGSLDSKSNSKSSASNNLVLSDTEQPPNPNPNRAQKALFGRGSGRGMRGGGGGGGGFAMTSSRRAARPCAIAHVPYNHNHAPFSFMRLVPCLMCRKHWVPEYILTSVEPPSSLPTRGKGRLLEVVVHRSRKKQPGAEMDAVKMSEVLPFIEFDLQRQIMLKLKVYGMNAVFGYTSSL